MAAKRFTLDDIHEAAEKEYGSVYLDFEEGEVELVNVLRLPKEKRKVIMDLAKKSEKSEQDEADTDIDRVREELLNGLKAACRTTGQAKILEKNVGHDTTYVLKAFSFYMGETEAGEASPSQD